jgi:hypothetical protein
MIACRLVVPKQRSRIASLGLMGFAVSLAPSPSSETRAPSAITIQFWKSSTAMLSIAIDGWLSISAPTC